MTDTRSSPGSASVWSRHNLFNLMAAVSKSNPKATEEELFLKIADTMVTHLTPVAQAAPKPVAHRWRQPGNKHWIYDPTPEWIEDHRHEIELQTLYASPPSPVAGEWQPIETAPKDGSWIIAICNDHSRLYRMSWGRARDGELWWCTATNSYGEGLFNRGGGWIPCPPSTVSSTQREGGK